VGPHILAAIADRREAACPASRSRRPLQRPARIELPPTPPLPQVSEKPDIASAQYSTHRTKLSTFRTSLSEHRTDLSTYRTDLSTHRTEMSMQRSE
jgi:hypothetical protein